MIHVGNCVDVLKQYPDNSIDAVVTDPPYGLSAEPDIVEVLTHWLRGDDYQHRGGGFMGKSWDSFVPGPSVWREVFRVLKPGGHALVFAGTRTYDLVCMALRLAGFQIRDQLAWFYSTGFPKSLDVAYELHKQAEQAAQHDLRFVSGVYLQTSVYACKECRQVLLACLSGSGSPQRWRAWSESEATRSEQPSVEGWYYLETPERELRRCSVCTMSHGILADGAQGRIHNGASAGYGASSGTIARQDGSSAPHRSRSVKQPSDEFDAVQLERRAQKIRGTGTALKPAQEPIALVRKPLIGTIAKNVLEYGTGGINIDGCRIAGEKPTTTRGAGGQNGRYGPLSAQGKIVDDGKGRWPANVLLDETAAAMLDAQTGSLKSGTAVRRNGVSGGQTSIVRAKPVGTPDLGYGDSGGASRFFYVAKASKAERERGLAEAGLPVRTGGELTDREDGSAGLNSPRAGAGRNGGRRNHHPTVKPIALMQYLVRLITPPGGLVLDPFCGSGSTGCAAKLEGFDFIGIDLEPDYTVLAEARIAAV